MPTAPGETSPLERYGQNLTTLAQQGAFSPLAGQEAVVDRAFQILLRKNKSNPMLLDLNEARRFAVMAEVVRCMAVGKAPDSLRTKQVIALDFEALFANLSDDTLLRQERIKQRQATLAEIWARIEQETDEEWFERVGNIPLWPQPEEWIAPNLALERLQTVFLAMHHAPNTFLLFVNHFHQLVGGEGNAYQINAFNILKPMLARRQIQLIGACTLEQYRQYIERDTALQRRFQEIVLPGTKLEQQQLGLIQ